MDLERLLENVSEKQRKLVDGERRARERESKERSRRNEELQTRLTLVEARISELFNRDALDSTSLTKLEEEVDSRWGDILEELRNIKELLFDESEVKEIRAMVKFATKASGAIETLKWAIPLSVAAAGGLAGAVGWALQHVKL